ncbi:transketolase [Salinarimonas sp.]|uniref:transketolase n=1 Tax=Salinarimonas sp. TaxID=2766526 RepID=UPI0032D96CB8
MASVDIASFIRRTALAVAHRADLGHPGGDLSCADILAVLFAEKLRYDSEDPSWPGRDRFILSKGHAAIAYYAALAAVGLLDPSELDSFGAFQSQLSGHPAVTKLPLVEASTGPLGHGLCVGGGIALAASLGSTRFDCYVLAGDGELQEGSNWEALMFAAHRRLDNLVLIVDRNRLQHGGHTEDICSLGDLRAKLESFGWLVSEIDGHDHLQLRSALSRDDQRGRPYCILANTVKGKGVSFMEGRADWHHRIPNSSELSLAIAEIEAAQDV